MRRRRRRGRARGTVHRQRVSFPIEERVERVGPKRFGILAVDSSKPHYSVLLADFYRNELLWRLDIPATAPALEQLIADVKALCGERKIKDLVVAVEQTGRYHVPIRNALKAHWEVRMVHPFAVKQLRQPIDPGNKTEPTDLRAIVRAMILGYGTPQEDLSQAWGDWREISRERESLVAHRAQVRVAIQGRIESLMPGYAALFADLWTTPTGQALAERYGSAAALVAAGPEAILEGLRQAGHRPQRRTVERVLEWARTACPPDRHGELGHRILRKQCALQRYLQSQILDYQRDLAGYLADSPCVLLLGIPGIDVVSAASYGAELGPIEHYTHPKKITGRAGLYPSRYQSDAVDLADGPLVGHRNARLRDALIEVAHNLITCNAYFKAWAHARRARGWPNDKIHVAVANKFARISYTLLAGRMAFDHPCVSGRDAVLRKLTDFGRRHGLAPETLRDLLLRAAAWLPPEVTAEEAEALRQRLPARQRRPKTEPSAGSPTRLGDVLRHLIARLQAGLPLEDERRPPRPRTSPRTPH